MASISVPAAMLGAGALSAGAGVLGSQSAADAQKSAANSANATQLAMFNQIQGLENPYVQTGYGAMNALNYLLGLPTQATSAAPLATSTSTGGAGALTDDQVSQILSGPYGSGIQQAYQTAKGTADPNSPAYQQHGLDSLQNYARYWYTNMRNPADYSLPGGQTAGATPAAATALNTAGLGAGSLLTPFSASNLQNDPGYQFRLNQGLGAVTNAASVGGFGGNTLKALNDYAQGQASQEYWTAYNADASRKNQIFNMLTTLSGSGQNAAANLASQGSNTASTIGQNTIGAGNASAAGTVGTTNALTGALNNGVSNYLLYNMMNGNPGSVEGLY